MITVAETSEFIRRAKTLLRDAERELLVRHLASHPGDGVLIEGTAGLRKLRWAREGKGKSGGTRVIYYYHSADMPLYLLTIYGKGEKDNLTAAEKNVLRGLVEILRRANGL